MSEGTKNEIVEKYLNKSKELFRERDVRVNALLLVGPLIAIIGSFLPWVTVKIKLEGSSASENMWEGFYGSIFCILLITAGVLVLLRMSKGARVPAVGAVLFFIIGWITGINYDGGLGELGDLFGDYLDGYIKTSMSFGFYIVLIGLAATVIMPFIKKEIYLDDLISQINEKIKK